MIDACWTRWEWIIILIIKFVIINEMKLLLAEHVNCHENLETRKLLYK